MFLCRVSVVYQKRLRRERKARKRVQDQLEQELKRRAQLEEMIKAAGAPADALRVLTGAYSSDGYNILTNALNHSWYRGNTGACVCMCVLQTLVVERT